MRPAGGGESRRERRRAWRRGRPVTELHDCTAAEAVRRTTALLSALAGLGYQAVPISQVLQWIDPGGQVVATAEQLQPPLDPRADPITGCLPVTAESAQPVPNDQVQRAE